MKQRIIFVIKCILKIYFKLLNPLFNIEIGSSSYLINTKISAKYRNNNSILIGDNVSLKKCNFIFLGKNNKIIIKDGAKLENVTFWLEDDFNLITIGNNTTFHGNCQLAACEGCHINIGNDCMFSHDIYVRTTDSHSIIKDNVRINLAKSITIGNHVWIGMQTLILKGANIPDGCIIGARSIISSSIMKNKNSIYVGHPSKLIKKDIAWKRERI